MDPEGVVLKLASQSFDVSRRGRFCAERDSNGAANFLNLKEHLRCALDSCPDREDTAADRINTQ